MKLLIRACVLATACHTLAEASLAQLRYLVVSSPTDHNIYYAPLPTLHDLTKSPEDRPELTPTVLINGDEKCTGETCDDDSNLGLRSPKGIAVFQSANASVLYVSDTDAENIYAYDLSTSMQHGTLTVGPQRRVVEGVAGGASWITVDGLGNLFFTVGANAQIEMVPMQDLFTGKPVGSTVLYAQDKATVSRPGGLASDNYFLYWANQDAGETAGTVVRAYESKARADSQSSGAFPKQLAANAAAASSVCLARDTVFYTGVSQSLFAVKRDGGAIAEVSHGFNAPRGCIYDLEGTIYVADSADNRVYSLPGNFGSLRAVRRLTRVMEVEGPWSLAVVTGSMTHVYGGAARLTSASAALLAILFAMTTLI